jgi:hypothetical protein
MEPMSARKKPLSKRAIEKEYNAFIASKRLAVPSTGLAGPPSLNASLFPFQEAVTSWALRRGRSALWLDTGLGKSRCAIEWARVVSETQGGRVMIFTPLAVAQQFVREGASIGVKVTLCREVTDVQDGVNVTNYDRLDRFSSLPWAGVVLDESSILKDQTSATRNALIQAFNQVPFLLACSATPSPNDHTELGNHAEFLGIMTRTEMLSMFFVHDGETTQEWRLKGHAKEEFWRWVASWGLAVRKPSDLGFDDSRYDLPPLRIIEHICDGNDERMAKENGLLFGYEARTLTDLRAARRSSLDDRVAEVTNIANESDGPVIVWCDLNDESDALSKSIGGAVEVRGSDVASVKESRIMSFIDGESRVLVTKPSICGAGLNMQHCSKMVFAGISFSWEAFYQAVRRCYRFGQKSEVEVHIVTSSAEIAVLESIKRKQAAADAMSAGMISYMRETMMAALGSTGQTHVGYAPKMPMSIPEWLIGNNNSKQAEMRETV